MSKSDAKHWDEVYGTRAEEALTWFEARPDLSLALIGTYSGQERSVIDIGGGVSRLTDHLLEDGNWDVTVVDLSPAALGVARRRLGVKAGRVRWIAADVTRWRAERVYSVWHDRAVFHFLTKEAERAGYVAAMQAALGPGGHAIIATFAEDGPEICSGLPVVRYAPDDLAGELEQLAPGVFHTVEARRFVHRTPKGGEQAFQVSVFRVSS